MVFKKSTLQLLRFPFSFFLMPVFWFALSNVTLINLPKTVLIFCIIHLLVYPSSNGYNSYMDRDKGSIGGIEHPLEPERELFYVTLVMDVLACLLSLIISITFTFLLLCYIVCSRLYSYRGIRLKKYPIIGYITVILNQGGLLFYLVYAGCAQSAIHQIPWLGILAACFLIGGFYPITQVYQHEADAQDQVLTISRLLGIRGTFIFCSIMYSIAFIFLFLYYQSNAHANYFLLLQIFFIPVLVYFIKWTFIIWKNAQKADFAHTMKMNWIASGCTNSGFILLLILHHFG